MLILVILSHLGNHTIFNILLLYIIYSLLYSYFLLFSHVFFFIIISYLFSTFADTIRKPMKIGCADGVCSHLNHVLTASSASDSACSEQLLYFYIRIKTGEETLGVSSPMIIPISFLKYKIQCIKMTYFFVKKQPNVHL